MIKYYYQYLLESKKMVGYDELTEMDYNSLLQKNCKDYLKTECQIFRVVNLDNKNYYYDSQHDYTRKSITTKNYYTLMMDHIFKNNWKDYPMREKSLICGSDMFIAHNWYHMYNGKYNIYQVIPYDGVTIGVCPMHDMWYSFTESNIGNLYNLNTYFNILSGYFKVKNLPDLEKLNYLFDIPKSEFLNEEFEQECSPLSSIHYNFIRSQFNTLRDYFSHYFKPELNDFSIKYSKDAIPMMREVWLEGPCLLKYVEYNKEDDI